jgi:hypothetical protein
MTSTLTFVFSFSRFLDCSFQLFQRVKELILTEIVRRNPQKVNCGEICEADWRFVREKGTEEWILDDGSETGKARMGKGFTADFRPPPPEMKAQLDGSKSAAAVKRFLVRQGYRPPAFLSHGR